MFATDQTPPPVVAAEAAQTPAKITIPSNQIRGPRQDEWDRVLPPPDRFPRLSVTLKCAVGDKGMVTTCEVLDESPVGAGVGAAALKVSRRFRVPATLNGQSTKGGEVIIPVRMERRF